MRVQLVQSNYQITNFLHRVLWKVDPMNFKITFNTTVRHMTDKMMVSVESCERNAALKLLRHMGETIDGSGAKKMGSF